MKRILIIGATSAIARETARLWVAQDNHVELFLVARDQEKLAQTKFDLEARGALVTAYNLDVNILDQHQPMLEKCVQVLKQIDIALIAHGTLSDQALCETDINAMLTEFNTNALSVMALLSLLANQMETQQQGRLVIISSVAGDRGRPSNYVYGSAKAAVTTFCEGLRARLFKKGVSVTVIKPGFVNTPMTQDLALPQLLVTEPEKVARSIVKAVASKKSVSYTPWFWYFIMTIIKLIPQPLFKRLNL